MSLLDDSEKLRLAIIDGALDGIPEMEEKVYQKLVRLMDEFAAKGGYFVNEKASVQKLLTLQSEVENILKEAGYFRNVNRYIADLAKITQNTIDLQKGINSLDIQKRSLTGIEKTFVHNVVQVLNEGGLNTNFISPVTNALNEAITYGYSIQTTRDTMRDLVLGNPETGGGGKLNRYLTVTARDTVSQMQGAQHQAIANEYEMKYIRYVGALLKDSRGQCVRWKGMKYIEIGQIEEEIALAFKNQKRKIEEGGHKWSGMIPDTNAQNFLIRRGGWGCLHAAIPSLKKY